MSMSSSDSPSEKYSWFFFSLMSTNGRTATDLSRIVGAAGTDTGADTTGAATGMATARRFDNHRRSTAKPRKPKPTPEAKTRANLRVDGADTGDVAGVGASADTAAGAFTATCTAATSLGIARSMSPDLASSQCDAITKYSKSAGSDTWSIRSDTIGCRLEAERSTSLRTCGDDAASFDNINTLALAASIA